MPSLFFTASTQSSAQELRLFAQEVSSSDLPGADLFSGVTVDSWESALRLLAAALPDDRPSIVVFDELPYLMAADPAFEGTLQKLFDRELRRKQTNVPEVDLIDADKARSLDLCTPSGRSSGCRTRRSTAVTPQRWSGIARRCPGPPTARP